MPVASAGLILGGLTLAGVPLTAGFSPYWQLLHSVAQIDSRGVVLLVLGGLGVVIGYLRGLRAALFLDHKAGETPYFSLKFQEPRALIGVITILGLICLLLGLFPSLLIEPLQTATINIPFPIR